MNKKIISIMLLVAFLVPFVPQTQAAVAGAVLGTAAAAGIIGGAVHHHHKKHGGEHHHHHHGHHGHHHEAHAKVAA